MSCGAACGNLNVQNNQTARACSLAVILNRSCTITHLRWAGSCACMVLAQMATACARRLSGHTCSVHHTGRCADMYRRYTWYFTAFRNIFATDRFRCCRPTPLRSAKCVRPEKAVKKLRYVNCTFSRTRVLYHWLRNVAWGNGVGRNTMRHCMRHGHYICAGVALMYAYIYLIVARFP